MESKLEKNLKEVVIAAIAQIRKADTNEERGEAFRDLDSYEAIAQLIGFKAVAQSMGFESEYEALIASIVPTNKNKRV